MALHLPIAILAALSLTSGDRVVLCDGPLMGAAHSAYSSLTEARSHIQLDLCELIAKENSYEIRNAKCEDGKRF